MSPVISCDRQGYSGSSQADCRHRFQGRGLGKPVQRGGLLNIIQLFLVSVICVPASSPPRTTPHPMSASHGYQPRSSLSYTVSPMKAKLTPHSPLEKRGNRLVQLRLSHEQAGFSSQTSAPSLPHVSPRTSPTTGQKACSWSLKPARPQLCPLTSSGEQP